MGNSYCCCCQAPCSIKPQVTLHVESQLMVDEAMELEVFFVGMSFQNS
jgi:hypothetical protein